MHNEHSVAATILAQLGGRMFLMMTGAKNLLADESSLTCRLGSGAKGSHLRVTLDASDTYTVETLRISRRGETVVVASADGVYVDSLQDVVESQTGFYLTMVARR